MLGWNAMVSQRKFKVTCIKHNNESQSHITIKKYPLLLLWYHHMKYNLLNSNAFPVSPQYSVVSLWLILKLKLVNTGCCERICLGPQKHQTSSNSQSANISDIPSYMQHSFKNLFKSYHIYIMSLLNLCKTTLYTACFDRHWSSSGVLKLFVETAVHAFCASNVWCVVPSHIRVSVTCMFRTVWEIVFWQTWCLFMCR
jgi:hypothetical protein